MGEYLNCLMKRRINVYTGNSSISGILMYYERNNLVVLKNYSMYFTDRWISKTGIILIKWNNIVTIRCDNPNHIEDNIEDYGKKNE